MIGSRATMTNSTRRPSSPTQTPNTGRRVGCDACEATSARVAMCCGAHLDDEGDALHDGRTATFRDKAKYRRTTKQRCRRRWSAPRSWRS